MQIDTTTCVKKEHNLNNVVYNNKISIYLKYEILFEIRIFPINNAFAGPGQLLFNIYSQLTYILFAIFVL